jgi:hypothetical protein
MATGTYSQRVSRTFNDDLDVGYSRNRGIAGVAGSVESEAQTFSYWFSGVNVSHPFGRSLDIFMNYQFQYQDNNTSGCTGSTCSTNTIRHQIAFGLNLHKQPIPF